MITANRADDGFDGVEVHVIHNISMSRKTISTIILLTTILLYTQRGGVVDIDEAITTTARGHRQIRTPRATQ